MTSSNDDLNLLKATRAYLHQQAQTHREALKQAGVDLDAITTADIKGWIADVVTVLRGEGQLDLAERYQKAFEAFDRAHAELGSANDRNEERADLQDAMNDALEEFERVEAEVTAALDKLDG